MSFNKKVYDECPNCGALLMGNNYICLFCIHEINKESEK